MFDHSVRFWNVNKNISCAAPVIFIMAFSDNILQAIMDEGLNHIFKKKKFRILVCFFCFFLLTPKGFAYGFIDAYYSVWKRTLGGGGSQPLNEANIHELSITLTKKSRV